MSAKEIIEKRLEAMKEEHAEMVKRYTEKMDEANTIQARIIAIRGAKDGMMAVLAELDEKAGAAPEKES